MQRSNRDHQISIHALREEGDSSHKVTSPPPNVFLSTPSARRATGSGPPDGSAPADFYPRPPRGGRPIAIDFDGILCQFLSTPSARRATKDAGAAVPFEAISIHALREEGDVPMVAARKGPGSISIHALREEGDFAHIRDTSARNRISIHALREEGDRRPMGLTFLPKKFLSTPSARRATRPCRSSWCRSWISIHALREEGDPGSNHPRPVHHHFYPRPPRGGRPFLPGEGKQDPDKFLSTPSARRATATLLRIAKAQNISIHALREEGDDRAVQPDPVQRGISIHALREEGDTVVDDWRQFF